MENKGNIPASKWGSSGPRNDGKAHTGGGGLRGRRQTGLAKKIWFFGRYGAGRENGGSKNLELPKCNLEGTLGK